MSLLLAVLIAQSGPILNNPGPQTGSTGTPITVNDCSILYFSNNLGQTFVAARGLKIEFTDESSKPADLVTFQVDGDLGTATIRDVAEIDPGVETTHRFRQFDRTRLWSRPNITCTVQAVHFTDGTVWENGKPSEASQALDPRLGLALENEASGVYVEFVAPGGAGDVAGIRQNDRIVSIGSNAVSSVQDIETILEMTAAGATVPLVVERSGTALNVKIKVSSAAEPASP
jgi:membrane-associated protease RseP (regulator of RpoE activity)